MPAGVVDPRPDRTPVLLIATLIILATGCTQPAPNEPDGQGAKPTASILVDWTLDRSDLVLAFDGPAPDDLIVRVISDAGGAVQLARQEMHGLDNETLGVPDPIQRAQGTTYTIRVLAGQTLLAERNVTAINASVGRPAGLDARAIYEAEQTQIRQPPDGLSITRVRGDATLTLDGGSHSFRLDASGTMHLVQGNLTMELDLHRFLAEDTDDRTTALELTGNGTWRLDDPPTHGSGNVTRFTSSFVGRETKQIAKGETVPAERYHRLIELTGSVQAERDNGTLTIHQQETTWHDQATGQPFWTQGNETRRFTFHNETTWHNRSWNESTQPSTAPPSLADLVDVHGLRPAAPSPGDRFTLEGPSTVAIRYTVEDAGTLDTAAGPLDVLAVNGHTTGPVNGSERWIIAERGELAGLPLTLDMSHTMQDQAFHMRMGLVEIDRQSNRP